MSLLDIRKNPLMLTDGYNLSHQILKCSTDWETSQIYNRNAPMIMYGVHEAIITALVTALDERITKLDIEEAEAYAGQMGVHFPAKLWYDVVNNLDGKLPLEVKMLAEGTWVPRGTPFVQIRNTVAGFGELVTWFEGLFLHSYFPCGCATEAYRAVKYLRAMQIKYGYGPSFLGRFHSFGFRGHRSLEDAYWAGTAWNLFFTGTDDFHTIQHTPNAPLGTIAAEAHKVTQQFDSEMSCYVYGIDAVEAAREHVLAIVIDTYDADRFIEQYAVPVAEYAAMAGVKVIFRPDSGDVLNQAINLYTKCVEVHGCTNTGVIIGMDMSFDRAMEYDRHLELAKVPLDYVSYGIGAGFYKHIERDTLGFAMKTGFSNGRPRMKFSNEPIKQSIPGIVDLFYDADGNMIAFTENEGKQFPRELSLYETIYRYDGEKEVVVMPNWDQTRETVRLQNDSQQEIILSAGIRALISEIRLIHNLD